MPTEEETERSKKEYIRATAEVGVAPDSKAIYFVHNIIKSNTGSHKSFSYQNEGINKPGNLLINLSEENRLRRKNNKNYFIRDISLLTSINKSGQAKSFMGISKEIGTP
ncbi:MAG: hypothetical protein U5K79_14860 [Cyclobacteriaceae bacterium]|nr:hypothetical protein [Cyclobacteriaceae bacterium]